MRRTTMKGRPGARNGQHTYHSTAVTSDTRDKLDLIKSELERTYGKMTYSDVVDELCNFWVSHYEEVGTYDESA
jgi:hypothetical protein